MPQYRLIFLIADPSLCRTPAFERAHSMAKASGAALHIGLFVHSHAIRLASALSRNSGRKARCAFLHERRRWLEQEAESLRGDGIVVTTDAVWTAHPRRDVLRHILRLQPDLVVKDADAPSFATRLLPNLEQDLLMQCPAQLLLAHADSAGASRHIAAAVDARRQGLQDKVFNDRIADTATALAKLCDADLHLVQAVPQAAPRHRPRRACRPAAPDLGPLAALAQAHAVPLDHCHRLQGAAGPAIAEFAARSGIDLLVVGCTWRKPMQRLLHPDGFERISFYTPCDVLALKQLPDDATHRARAVADRSRAVPAAPQLQPPRL
jgi:universal stress protein E